MTTKKVSKKILPNQQENMVIIGNTEAWWLQTHHNTFYICKQWLHHNSLGIQMLSEMKFAKAFII